MGEEEYLSGEQYQEMRHQQHWQQPRRPWLTRLPVLLSGLVLILALVFLAGWFSGAHNQKSHDSKLANSATTQFQQSPDTGGGPVMCNSNQPCSGRSGSAGPTICSGGTCTSGGGAPVTGAVTAADASNITIQLSGGNTETFTITNTTGFSKGAGSGELSVYGNGDVQVGETVGVVPSSSGSTQAQIIIANPPTSN